jgi:4Fe-4S ferredoxin
LCVAVPDLQSKAPQASINSYCRTFIADPNSTTMSKPKLTRGSVHDFKHPAGKLQPLVNTERCEGAGQCVEVCPTDVFLMRALTDTERAALSWKARIKVFVHGGKQAFAVNPDACRGCGLCVTACPEQAITLARNPTYGNPDIVAA